MATTSPDNIWTPDAGDDYALTTDLAAMADTVQDALNTVKTYIPMTDAQRLALTGGGLFEGLIVYTTDTNALWKYNGSSWDLFGIGPFKSTAASTSPGTTGTVTDVAAMSGLTGLALTQAIVTGVPCRAKVTLMFRYFSTGNNSNAVLGVAGSGATTITPVSTAVNTIYASSSVANTTSSFSGSWFVNLNAGTTTLSVVGQAVASGGSRTVSNIMLLVEPVSE